MYKPHGVVSTIRFNQGFNPSKQQILMQRIIKLFSAVLVGLAFGQTTTYASSHREAPLISSDPLADNTDVYAFKSPCDTSKIVLIANYIPFELPQGGPNYYNFGQNIRYEIHVKNKTTTTADDITYRFTFSQVNEDTTTFFNIRLGKQNLKTTYTLERGLNGVFTTIITNGVVPPNNIGPRSISNSPVGLGVPNYDTLVNRAIATATTGEKVFCGPADDAFFVDLGGAFDVGNFRQNGRDGLAKYNCHSIVVEVPVSTLQKDGKNTTQAASILDGDFVIGVWASASRREITTFDPATGTAAGSGSWVQVSRLGMPLTNEAVIPIGSKDRWNAVLTNTPADTFFNKYFKNPELALYMDDSQFGTAVPGLAALRIQSRSLGAFDFRNGKKGLAGLRGNSALNGTALSDAAFGAYLLPDTVSPRAVDLLPIFNTGVPNLRPYQLATGKNGDPLAAGKPFINNFLPTFGDMLRLNMAVPVTPRNDPNFSSLGLVQAAVLGLTNSAYNGSTAVQFIPNMDGFPNGRRLEDDVTTIELQAVGGVVLAAVGLWYDDYIPGTSPSPLTPQLLNVVSFNAGVTKNDTTFKPCFPYVQSPWAGFTGAQYVGPTNPPLPVDFLNFTATKLNRKVQLTWEVANEKNSAYYVVEQNTGGNFISLGTVYSTPGSGAKTYNFLDANPSFTKSNIYRIKQVDVDGKTTYSPLRLVRFDVATAISITPNPATNFIKVYSSSQQAIMLQLFDGSGKKVLTKTIVNGTGEVDIRSLPRGVYTAISTENGKKGEPIRIVKQ
jgi:hypothetical protein